MSAHSDRQITFSPISPADFGDSIAGLIGPHAAASVAGLYTSIAAVTDISVDKDHSASTILGLSPRTVSGWLTDLGVDLGQTVR